MALLDIDDMNRREAERKAEEERLRAEAVARYGIVLGGAFYNYVYEGHTEEKIEKNQSEFIAEVSNCMNSDAVEIGIDALVNSTRIKIEIAENRAANAPRRSIHV